MRTGAKVLAAGLAVGGLLASTACGSGGGNDEAVAAGPASDAGAAAYGVLLGAIDEAKVPLCQPAEGGEFVPLAAPAAAAARDFSYFRYLEGRIYEFGPCQLEAGKRNELRIYRYADVEARDAALRDVSARQSRPTSTFAFRDFHAVEIWSPEPSLDSPVGQMAATLHSALGRVPQSRHPDAPGGP